MESTGGRKESIVDNGTPQVHRGTPWATAGAPRGHHRDTCVRHA